MTQQNDKPEPQAEDPVQGPAATARMMEHLAARAEPYTATPEPPPQPGTGDVWAEVIATYEQGGAPTNVLQAMRARRDFGIRKYGTPLQRGNGRDTDRDLADELLDAIAYAHLAGRITMRRRLAGMLAEVLA